MKKRGLLLLASIAILVLGGGAAWYLTQDKEAPRSTFQPVRTEVEPLLTDETVADGLSNVWDVAQAPDSTLFYTERAGKIGAILDNKATTIYEPEGLVARGEGGMLGMTLDTDFSANRYMYVCFNTANDIRVVRFTVSQDNSSLNSRSDIITGLPANPSGRHSGCRPKFAPDGYLWVGTGDTARSEHPQSKTSLGGKILRVDRDGKAAPGNLTAPFDTRIYSYGHRNVQGLAFYSQPKNGVIGYSDEHGSDRDDEVNVLEKGNFGWDPGEGYDESVPMTDLQKFPDAIKPIWTSGRPTIAISGSTLLEGEQWKAWQGRLMVAVQKDKHVRLIEFGEDAKTLANEKQILTQFGRVRTVTLGTDGHAYLTTDNGKGADKIVRITAN